VDDGCSARFLPALHAPESRTALSQSTYAPRARRALQGMAAVLVVAMVLRVSGVCRVGGTRWHVSWLSCWAVRRGVDAHVVDRATNAHEEGLITCAGA
jgi:hypothetical protein